MTRMNIGHAMTAIRAGRLVTRASWTPGVLLRLKRNITNDPIEIEIVDANGGSRWWPSHEALLAEDWKVVTQ